MTTRDLVTSRNAKRFEDAVRKHCQATRNQSGLADLVTKFMRVCVNADGKALIGPDECAVRIGNDIQILKKSNVQHR